MAVSPTFAVMNSPTTRVSCASKDVLRELPYVKGRLTKPKIRRDGKLVEATWDEAMTLVAQKFWEAIAASGPDAAFYGPGIFSEESYTANKLFKAGIRTNNVDANARLCMASAAWRLHTGVRQGRTAWQLRGH